MSRSIAFFASHAAGGIRELWTDLAIGFAERGHAVELAALYPYEPEPDQEAGTLRWNYMVPDKPAGLGAKIRMLRNLAAWLRRDRPDVLITAMPAANVLIPVFARLFSPRTVVLTSHHSPVETHNRVLNAIDSQIGRLGTVRAIVGVSAAVSDSLAAKPASYRAKVRTIHNALPRRISAKLLAMAPARAAAVRGRSVVAAGRLAYQKNYPMLVRAARLMPGVMVEIVGGGPDEAALKEQAEQLGATGSVHFLGQRDRDETLALVARADVFVQVSLFEGHSLALLEAASLGLPLVVSDVPSQREGVTARDGTQCGIIVALDDDAGLARAILALLDDSAEYRRWAERSLRLAGEATFETMIAQYEALIA